ncbi:D-serine ammonia-lyase [Achromobacter piechaudii]|uniref:Probable D-serine dehydratase n=1 Tax=Achromobacter piechaudii ATCC 43553 TaxID=742159 RepID=D4XIR7_9BURK|nr:D-serine ammonia-lyase [Achromobacter piechaudii]EFF73295.1 D-serine ammonia-lyase [Achromobacter piechaudii ATCC 43553]
MTPLPASVSSFSLQALRAARPVLWIRPESDAAPAAAPFTLADVKAAHDRFTRFAPLLAQLFPELQETAGVIESPLLETAAMQQTLGLPASAGRLWVKADHALPVAGSIKARGGIHEVLEFTEKLALAQGLIAPGDDYLKLATPQARACFSQYQVAVGSTGNLGLSIGVIASALGFRAAVHMSADAKEWKKARLRKRGVEVVEHPGDYEKAVAAGRRQVDAHPKGYFVDDERSASLFLGYAAAALALRAQIDQAGIVVDAEHPLFVYLPCGVGGAPGGIAFGLSLIYGKHVHCFFAEPVQSPCFLLRMMAGHGQLPGVPVPPSVYDIGLTNQTKADGLAVPRASDLAYDAVGGLLAGVYTVADDTLYSDLARLHDSEGLRIEPSAAAGFSGPRHLLGSLQGQQWLRQRGLSAHLPRATHLAWTTGGLFVPAEEYDQFLSRGLRLAAAPAAHTDAPSLHHSRRA